jgi:hypothetical protein
MQSVWSPNSKYQKAAALMLLSGMTSQDIADIETSEETKSLALKANAYRAKHAGYFDSLHADYILRRDLTLCLINGEDKYKTLHFSLTPVAVLQEAYKDIISKEGICGFSAPVIPQAGMFLLIQADKCVFEKLSDYKYPDLVFAKFLYKEANVAMLPSTELTLPEEERMFRIEFGVAAGQLVKALQSIHAFTQDFLGLSAQELAQMESRHLSDQEIYSSKKSIKNIASF